MRLRNLLPIVFLLAASAFAKATEAGIGSLATPSTAESPAQTAGAPATAHSMKIFAGGVAGVEALARPEASAKFREAGGGLYLHNNGWADLSPAQQRQTLANFKNLPVAIELGFGGSPGAAQAWAERLRSGYLTLGIKPAFIAANAFAGNNKPTAAQWAAFSKALRATNLPASTQILPTFEFANFGENISTLTENTVSKRQDFQDIIRIAGGLVLDSPPGYVFSREDNYRAWLIDAIHWCRKQGLTVVWIASPHTFGDRFLQDTEKFLGFLRQNGAMPTAIVVENYTDSPPRNYPNVVGQEDMLNTVLGVALYLLGRQQSAD